MLCVAWLSESTSTYSIIVIVCFCNALYLYAVLYSPVQYRQLNNVQGVMYIARVCVCVCAQCVVGRCQSHCSVLIALVVPRECCVFVIRWY